MALVVQAAFLFVGAFLVIVNFRHAAGCIGRYDNSDEVMRRRALEHRLRSMEKEVRDNSLVLQKFLTSLERQFSISDLVELRDLKRECHNEAKAIVSKLAEEPPPPMPNFEGLADFAEGDTITALDDKIADDDVFGGRLKDEYEELPQEVVEPLPSVSERSETCKDWRSRYGVSPGVSWGALPLDLQQRWRTYDCDIFLQESVQGMLRGADDDDDAVVVGEVSSVAARGSD